MSDASTAIVYGFIFLSVLSYNSDIFESNRITEYNEDQRCVLPSSVVRDVNNGKPIKQGADGKWDWYTPSPQEYSCFRDNLSKINYRTYGEAGKVVAWTDEGDGQILEFRDCIIADTKNWMCTTPVRIMTEGVSNPGHIGHWKWVVNWMLDFARGARKSGE
jgi:hypothetical protein